MAKNTSITKTRLSSGQQWQLLKKPYYVNNSVNSVGTMDLLSDFIAHTHRNYRIKTDIAGL